MKGRLCQKTASSDEFIRGRSCAENSLLCGGSKLKNDETGLVADINSQITSNIHAFR